MADEIHEFTPINNNRYQMQLAMSMHSTDAEDLFHLHKAIATLMGDLGEDKLRQLFGESYKDSMLRFRKIGRDLYKIKAHYDSIARKETGALDLESDNFAEFEEMLSRLAFNSTDIFLAQLTAKLIQNTNLQGLVIKNSYLKAAELKYHKLDYQPPDKAELRKSIEGEENES